MSRESCVRLGRALLSAQNYAQKSIEHRTLDSPFCSRADWDAEYRIGVERNPMHGNHWIGFLYLFSAHLECKFKCNVERCERLFRLFWNGRARGTGITHLSTANRCVCGILTFSSSFFNRKIGLSRRGLDRTRLLSHNPLTSSIRHNDINLFLKGDAAAASGGAKKQMISIRLFRMGETALQISFRFVRMSSGWRWFINYPFQTETEAHPSPSSTASHSIRV